MNIILIGMPAAGKSTAGVKLAKELGYQFVDSDLIIQTQEDKLLKDIIKERGVDGFIALENKINQSICTKNSVIATGGSAVYGMQAMEHFHQIGIVVYIRLRYETIEKRLGNIVLRGVVLREHQTLKDLYEERSVLYEKYADRIVDADCLNVEELVKKLMEEVKK